MNTESSEGVGIKQSVLRMYLSRPFPNLTADQRREQLPSELCRYHALGLSDAMRGARFLDVGCGTGDRSMLAAKHFGVAEFVGLDHSRVSLDIAAETAKDEGFDGFVPVEGDVLAQPFPDASFDVVVSWGVLHHTSDPWRGFQEMVRVCKPGGYVGLYLYNRWGHWRHNMQKSKVSRLAGDDVDERFAVAHRLYGKKPVEQMTPMEIASFYDQYCHPHKSDHTLDETLEWFERTGLAYTGSFPPLKVGEAVSCMKIRAALASEHPIRRRHYQVAASLAAHLPDWQGASDHAAPPTLAHTVLWQSVFAFIGRHGAYSMGSALAARKPW